MKTKSMLMLIVSLMISGCASQQAATLKPGHAICTVCSCENDLACLDVKLDANTPRFEYAGKTYYFCSEECRNRFAGNPGKYLPK